MENSVEKAGHAKVAAIIFLTFGLILYSVPPFAFAASQASQASSGTSDSSSSQGSTSSGTTSTETDTQGNTGTSGTQANTGSTGIGNNGVTAPAAMTENERAATKAEASLDTLTQSAAGESQRDQTLTNAFSQQPAGNNQGQTGNGQQGQAGGQSTNGTDNAQARVGQRIVAVSNTLGEFTSLCGRQGTAGTGGTSQSAEGTQNFAAAMNVMGNSSFLSQLVMSDMKEKAPAGFGNQIKVQIDGMAQRFSDMAQRFSQAATQGQNGNSTGTGTGGPMSGPNGLMNPAGGANPPIGPNGSIDPGPNSPTGKEMIGPMPGMEMMTSSDMAMAATAIAMGASPDKVMEGMSHMMEARAQFMVANFGNNANNSNGPNPMEGPRLEGTTGPTGPMSFMPGAGGVGFMPTGEGTAFMAAAGAGAMPGAGFAPAADAFFGGAAATAADPAAAAAVAAAYLTGGGPYTPAAGLAQAGPTSGELAQQISQNQLTNQIQQQQIVQQIVQANPRAAAELQALRGANVTIAAINASGGSVTRNDITFIDPSSNHTDHLHNVIFTVGNEGGVQHVDANVTGGVHDHDINQIVDNSSSQSHIPVN